MLLSVFFVKVFYCSVCYRICCWNNISKLFIRKYYWILYLYHSCVICTLTSLCSLVIFIIISSYQSFIWCVIICSVLLTMMHMYNVWLIK